MKLLQFKAEWCNPCKLQTKEFESNKLNVELSAINVDDDPDDLTNQYKVRSIPTMVLINDNGEEINRWSNFTKVGIINEFIDNYDKE